MTAPGKATVRIDDAALKRRMRGLLAQAWDEGRLAGVTDASRVVGWGVGGCKADQMPVDTPNPYRDEADA